jgi:hypothetical protein
MGIPCCRARLAFHDFVGDVADVTLGQLRKTNIANDRQHITMKPPPDFMDAAQPPCQDRLDIGSPVQQMLFQWHRVL